MLKTLPLPSELFNSFKSVLSVTHGFSPWTTARVGTFAETSILVFRIGSGWLPLPESDLTILAMVDFSWRWLDDSCDGLTIPAMRSQVEMELATQDWIRM